MIENIYAAFVNLEHRKDRLEHMKRELNRVGLTAHRFNAYKTADYKWDAIKTFVMRNRTPGAIGCYHSQMEVMRAALAEKKNALVMEDDLVFCEDFLRRMVYIDNFCKNNDWDIIWLGGTFHTNPPYWHTGNNPDLKNSALGFDALTTEDPRMMRTFGCFCTYAYIVNVNSIQKVLDKLDEIMYMSMGIDWSMIYLQPQWLTYAFVPGCIKQMDNQSDIGKGITYFSGFSKLGPYWWQNKMDDFDPLTHDWGEASKNIMSKKLKHVHK